MGCRQFHFPSDYVACLQDMVFPARCDWFESGQQARISVMKCTVVFLLVLCHAVSTTVFDSWCVKFSLQVYWQKSVKFMKHCTWIFFLVFQSRCKYGSVLWLQPCCSVFFMYTPIITALLSSLTVLTILKAVLLSAVCFGIMTDILFPFATNFIVILYMSTLSDVSFSLTNPRSLPVATCEMWCRSGVRSRVTELSLWIVRCNVYCCIIMLHSSTSTSNRSVDRIVALSSKCLSNFLS